MSPARSRRESNPPEGDRQSPNVTRRTRKQDGREGWIRTNNLDRSERCVLPVELLPHVESGPGESNPGSLVWKTRVRDHRTATRKQRARASTGARGRTWTV